MIKHTLRFALLLTLLLPAAGCVELEDEGVDTELAEKSVDVSSRNTTCTAGSGVKAKLKAGPRDPGQIKTNVQIDDVGATARAWTITIVDGAENQTAVVTTAGASNSLDRDFFTTNNAGGETVSFTATRAGATCSGSVTLP